MIRSFVISDVHLGEEESILTYGKTDDRHYMVDKLIDKVKEVSDLPNGERVPELVLLGDIFDLSLAPFDETLTSVRKFINQICEADIFDTITYVPGNHDHHMWVQILEHEVFIKNIAERSPVPNTYSRVTQPGEPQRNTFLDGLLPASATDVTFQVAYPNRVLEVAGTRIIMHHGHLCERIWRLLSLAIESILPTNTINELEAFNSPFTEFGWYGLGQAGNAGALMEKIYENAKAGKFDGIYEVIDALMDAIDRWDGRLDDGWRTDAKDWLSKRAVRKVVKSLLEKYARREEAGSAGMSEARGKTIANNDELREGVTRYLSKYVEIQDGEKFIFGHTHRHTPAQEFSINGRTVEIANTGGWVEEPGGHKPDGYLIEITDQAELRSHHIDIP